LRRLAFDRRVAYTVSFNNSSALADTFNPRITARDGAEVLVFAHDDVWLDDFFIVEHVAEGLNARDLIGVVGNRRRAPKQPGWAFLERAPDGELRWDDAANLRGDRARSDVFRAGGQLRSRGGRCELLDGVLLAAQRSRLADAGALFDPALRFPLYDLDFCRTARAKGLSLGTCPLAVKHQSGGSFGGPEWERMYALYLEKWGD
jgi:hypothetical protein